MSDKVSDVKRRIFKVAMELFCQHSYDDVEMRQIAAKCDIAVGTLYNYYANKLQLFTDILVTVWQKTLDELDNIDAQKLGPQDRVLSYVTVLYDSIAKHQGFMYPITKSKPCDIYKSPQINHFKRILVDRVKVMVEDLSKDDQLQESHDLEAKISYMTLISTMGLVEAYPEDREDNIKCLYQLVRSFLKID